MVSLGETARELRTRLGLTQKEAAEALSISTVHLSEIENGKAMPSPALQGRFREVLGVDLYVMAWAEHGDAKDLPPRLRRAAEELKAAWRERIDQLAKRK